MTADGPVLDFTRKGYVLVVVLLLLVAVTGVGHALLVMTQSESLVSRARWEMVVRRFAAEAGRNLTYRAMSSADSLAPGRWVPMGSAPVPPRARYEASAVRLSSEVFLVLAEGSLDGQPGRDRQVGLYWAMDPATRLGTARGIIESEGPLQVQAGSTVDSSLLRDVPQPWRDSACARFRQDESPPEYALPAHGELNEDARAELGGERATDTGDPLLPSLGLLGHDALIAGADVHVSGTVSPTPTRARGGCDIASSLNWGAPHDPTNPCAGYRPVTASDASLVLDGGEGQGILLISGDLTLQRAARYYGLVVVAGDLRIIGESEIHGLVRVRGRVIIGGRSRIVGSACAFLSALDAAQELRNLIPVPESAWPDSR